MRTETFKDKYKDIEGIVRLLKDFNIKLTEDEKVQMMSMNQFQRNNFKNHKIDTALMA